MIFINEKLSQMDQESENPQWTPPPNIPQVRLLGGHDSAVNVRASCWGWKGLFIT